MHCLVFQAPWDWSYTMCLLQSISHWFWNSVYTIKLRTAGIGVSKFKYKLTLPLWCETRLLRWQFPAGVRSSLNKPYPCSHSLRSIFQPMATVHISTAWEQGVVAKNLFCNLVQFSATWCRLVQIGAVSCSLVQFGAASCNLVRLGADWCNLVQFGAT